MPLLADVFDVRVLQLSIERPGADYAVLRAELEMSYTVNSCISAPSRLAWCRTYWQPSTQRYGRQRTIW